MSVPGEFRRLLGDLLATLGEAGHAKGVDALEPLLARSSKDLCGAAAEALETLPEVSASAIAGEPGALRERYEDALERFEAVCRVILGTSSRP